VPRTCFSSDRECSVCLYLCVCVFVCVCVCVYVCVCVIASVYACAPQRQSAPYFQEAVPGKTPRFSGRGSCFIIIQLQ
jgi:hypothetical protein